jgi:hypothetical protein
MKKKEEKNERTRSIQLLMYSKRSFTILIRSFPPEGNFFFQAK